jgi:hypothetical protein
MEICHKVVLFQEWDSGPGSILAKEIELPFAPFPGLCLRIGKREEGEYGEADVTVNGVTFRSKTGTFLCEVESSMGKLVDHLDNDKEFDRAYEYYLLLGFIPACGLSVLGEPYDEWDGSFFKKSDGSWFPGQEPPKAKSKRRKDKG